MAHLVAGVLAPFQTLIVHRKVIGTFVRRDLRGRYVNSVLGFAWAVIQPLSLLVLYTFVFSVVLGIRLGRDTSTTGFAFYLFCGMLPWLAFAEGLTRSTSAIVDHAHLIKKVVFPSEILPAYVVASALVTELIALGIFVVAASVFYRPPGWTVLGLPVVIVLQVMLTLGLGWFLASLNVFLRDIGQGLGLALTLWMLLTPIFYPPDMVPPRFRWVLGWNPLHYLVQAYRDVLLDHQLPAPAHLVALGTIAVAAFLAGSWFFRRSKNAFIDVI